MIGLEMTEPTMVRTAMTVEECVLMSRTGRVLPWPSRDSVPVSSAELSNE